MPSSPWRTAHLNVEGTASACTLWWSRSQLHSAARPAYRQVRGSWRLFRLFTWGILSQREWGASGPASAEAAWGELSQGGGCPGAAALRSAHLSLHSPVSSVPSSVLHREDEQEGNSPLISGLLWLSRSQTRKRRRFGNPDCHKWEYIQSYSSKRLVWALAGACIQWLWTIPRLGPHFFSQVPPSPDKKIPFLRKHVFNKIQWDGMVHSPIRPRKYGSLRKTWTPI